MRKRSATSFATLNRCKTTNLSMISSNKKMSKSNRRKRATKRPTRGRMIKIKSRTTMMMSKLA